MIKQRINLDNSYLDYYRQVFSPTAVHNMCLALLEELHWQQEHIKIFGKTINSPRLQSFYGDDGVNYRYSGRTFKATPWAPCLERLRRAVSEITNQPFNGVLCNLYRDGDDAMGWHSDNEPELGANPVIASLTFGASRRFSLRKIGESKQRFSLELENNSLLIMPAGFQSHYQHALPRSKRISRPRINLTFRMFYN
ncbi:alpha-ketoglutarate-dependent dioxygenase AlkB family protein [Litoribrevibacter albus]|uniref:alpha-ketoglutarate-dependent dioxygenase AlkB family protein n=1 Tax=Litoribrevibacter albus TaxID=1473156 RepID=UPI0024E1620D|nr:alpha-ketoglutarate-dependent dioxygenase AlkB [Litoribrevibacter albus]